MTLSFVLLWAALIFATLAAINIVPLPVISGWAALALYVGSVLADRMGK